MVTMHFLQVRLHVALFVLFLALNRATPSVWESYVWILSKTHVPCMFVTCKLPLFVLCDGISVTIAYSVGNKNTHIDNLITWYIYMAKWERNSCPWLPHARARWYGCIHANDTVQDVGCCLSVWLAAVINDKGPHTIISNYWMRLSMPS